MAKLNPILLHNIKVQYNDSTYFGVNSHCDHQKQYVVIHQVMMSFSRFSHGSE